MQEERIFSEHREQIVIRDYFNQHPPKHHFLVDVGACEQALSNTAALILAGWKGLLLEPSPAFYTTLLKQWEGYPVEIISTAAGDTTEQATFYIHTGMGHDSLIPTWYTHDKRTHPIKVQVRPFAEILAERKIPLDFDLLSIDAEGYDKKIMTHLFETSKYRPTLICTEITSYRGDFGIFLKQGYKEVAKEGNNEWANLFFARD